MASSLPPNWLRAARSFSSCFWVLSCAIFRSIWLFSCQREKKIQATTRAATARAIEEYRRGFLRMGLDCGWGGSEVESIRVYSSSITRVSVPQWLDAWTECLVPEHLAE